MRTLFWRAVALTIVILNTVPVFAQNADTPSRFVFGDNHWRMDPDTGRRSISARHKMMPGQVIMPQGIGIEDMLLDTPAATGTPPLLPPIVEPTVHAAVSMPKRAAPEHRPYIHPQVTKKPDPHRGGAPAPPVVSTIDSYPAGFGFSDPVETTRTATSVKAKLICSPAPQPSQEPH